MTSIPWMIWIILIPLVMAALFFFIKRTVLGLFVIVPILGIPLCVAGLTLRILKYGPVRYAVGGWKEPLGISLYADGLSALLLLMTAVVGSCISIYSLRYFDKGDHDKREKLFWPLWLFLWGALNALFLSADVFNIYVTLELMGLSAVALITISGGRPALTGAMRYLLVAALGSLFYLLGVALLYDNYSSLGIDTLSRAIRSDMPTHAAVVLITSGLLIKTALFPLHFWLPPAHANAPAPVSAMLSGLVVKASFYLLMRLWFGVFSSVVPSGAAQFLGVLGVSAILWGSFFALRQRSLKMLIAYSTVAQIGYLFLLFPLAASSAVSVIAMNGCVYHVISHAFAKSALFLSSGNIILALGHDRIEDMGGIVRHLRVTTFTVGLSGVSLMGLPISGGFTAKWLFLSAALGSGQWWWAVFIIAGSLMAAGYVFLIWKRVFEEKQESMPLKPPVPAGMELSALILSILSLVLGLTAEPVLKMLSVGSYF
jgi:multicomponent Na+:H+ antiporter subunit D